MHLVFLHLDRSTFNRTRCKTVEWLHGGKFSKIITESFFAKFFIFRCCTNAQNRCHFVRFQLQANIVQRRREQMTFLVRERGERECRCERVRQRERQWVCVSKSDRVGECKSDRERERERESKMERKREREGKKKGIGCLIWRRLIVEKPKILHRRTSFACFCFKNVKRTTKTTKERLLASGVTTATS